ncbi:MAG: single-stranded DNA-binding protein [Candidatus Levybacteria bacterium]|nr:single-stranded DNA-binding protein [Candidatus Levybacteria bacterium]
MARSLNRVQLIGNLTRDPELRYTPNGIAVCSIGLATNRSWTTDSGEKKEDTEFHKIVAWNKLAELCSQFLVKGRKVYVEGRLSTRSWTAQDGTQKTTTEVVIDNMILLDSKRPVEDTAQDNQAAPAPEVQSNQAAPEVQKTKKTKKEEVEEVKKSENTQETADENISPDDIPF